MLGVPDHAQGEQRPENRLVREVETGRQGGRPLDAVREAVVVRVRRLPEKDGQRVEEGVERVAAAAGARGVRGVERDVEQQDRQRQAERRPHEVEEGRALRDPRDQRHAKVHERAGHEPQSVAEEELGRDHASPLGLQRREERRQREAAGRRVDKERRVEEGDVDVPLLHRHQPPEPRVPPRGALPRVRVARPVAVFVVPAVL